MTKRIGLLTSGGDAPGQNVCLKSLVYDAVDQGYEVVGIRKGWEGLLRFEPDNPATHAENAMALNKSRVRDIDRMAGSFLHSSRLNPDSVAPQAAPASLRPAAGNGRPLDLTDQIKRAVDRLRLDALVVLGNNSSLQYAARLSKEGVPVIGIPMSVENDVNGSQYALGFSTALASGVHRLHELRAMAGSREEIAVVELFGRKYGLTTMLIAALAGADRVLIPEVAFDPDLLARRLQEDKRSAPANYAILAMSESVTIEPAEASKYSADVRLRGLAGSAAGEARPFTIAGEREIGVGAGGSGAVVTEILESLLGERMVFQPLNYLLRVGEPDGQDLLGAVNFAMQAVELLAAGKAGRLVVYRRGINYTDLPIETVTEPDGKDDMVEFYDRAAYRARPGIMWAARV